MAAAAAPATMRAVVVRQLGDPRDAATLEVQTVPVRDPRDAEVRIKVKCAAVNPVDYKLIEGTGPMSKKAGALVGFDVSGVVDAVGPNCTSGLQVGDEVYADVAKTQGSFAELVTAQEKCVCRKPPCLTFRAAASLPLAGLTAIQALQRQGQLQAGGKVGVLGGSGGVGSLAIQVAKALGAAHVVTTASSPDYVKALGADQCINYREESVEEALRGQDLDVVFDCVGGRASWVQAQAGLKPGGTFVTIVGDDPVPGLRMLLGIAGRKLWSFFGGPGYKVFLTDTSDHVAEDMRTLSALVDQGKLKPQLDERKFALTDESVREMFAAIMSHRTKGKLVMDVA